ncbi:MAG: DUF2339 domain-containing protein, partial [Phycisphaerae bacterium]|nr:DUF2339 domain-containing protein [Phycisphaerae bacterium]
MDERELARTLRALEERLLRLERFAGLEAPADAVIEPPPPPTPPLVPPLVPLPVPPPVPPLATPGETSARPRGAASSSISTEHIIGGRIAAWVGAIIVMIGVGVFVKYAYDRGWFVMFGGWGRLVAATVVAFGLIVLGWLSMRRWGRAAAAGLLCAGVGSLFVIAAAGTRPEVIGVLSPIGSLGYALAAIAIASFAAARSGLLAVSVVAAIGAYAVPLLVGVLRLETSLVPAGYLTLALAAFLALSHWASSQRQVRGVAVGLHIAVAALLLMTGRLAPAAAQAFVLIWWGLVVLETIASVVRAELRDDRSNTGSNDAAIATIATAASIVAAFVFAGTWAGFGDLWSWMPLGQGVLCVAASAVLHGMRGEPDLAAPSAARSRVWSSTESMPIARMSTTLGTIGAGAIAASLALLLTDRGAGAAWAIMAVAGTAVAVRIGSRGLAVLASLCCAASTAVAAWVSLTERVSGIGTGPVPIPWLSGSAVGLSPGWWLPLGALLAAIASLHLLGSLASSAPIRGFLAVLAAISMATVALVVGRAESILLVAALLPAWLSFAPG